MWERMGYGKGTIKLVKCSENNAFRCLLAHMHFQMPKIWLTQYSMGSTFLLKMLKMKTTLQWFLLKPLRQLNSGENLTFLT